MGVPVCDELNAPPSKVETDIRREICRIGALLHQRGYVAACDGNISVKIAADRIMCTPTSLSKGMMSPEDLVIVDMKGQQKEGRRRPSSELKMHLMFYDLRADIGAVVHAHPPTATGFAAAGLSLEEPIIAEVVLACGKIPLAGYATPGSSELSAMMCPFIPMYDAILMANHGVVTAGSDLLSAYMKMETVEHCARINLVARQLGSARPLAPDEVAKLMQIRKSYGMNKAS